MASRASVRTRTRGRSAAVARSHTSRGGASRARVIEIQRSRLLAGALGAIEDLGWIPRVTVAHIGFAGAGFAAHVL